MPELRTTHFTLPTSHEVDAQLRETLDRMSRCSPFFQAWFKKHGIAVTSIRSMADLPMIPRLEKHELVAAGRDAWCVKPSEVVDVVSTSGTTGQSLLMPLTRKDVDRLGASEAFSFQCAGLTEQDRVVLGVTLDRCFMAGLAYREGLNRIGAMSVRVGAAAPALMLEMIERLDATAVVSVPSFLAKVAAYAASHGIDLRMMNVQRLICIGEAVRLADFSPTPLTQKLEQAWGAKVYATFGATELASSMCECEQFAGGHLCPSLHHVEVLNEQGDPVPPTEAGELAITTFGVEGLPLVRYRLGDLASIDYSPCACGRSTPRLGPVVGRMQQRLKIKGVSVDPASAQHILSLYPQIEDMLLIAGSDEHGGDTLEVLLAIKQGQASDIEMFRESLRGLLKVLPAVTVSTAQKIEALRHVESRKRQFLLDRRGR